jgi:hypothetical protein
VRQDPKFSSREYESCSNRCAANGASTQGPVDAGCQAGPTLHAAESVRWRPAPGTRLLLRTAPRSLRAVRGRP